MRTRGRRVALTMIPVLLIAASVALLIAWQRLGSGGESDSIRQSAPNTGGSALAALAPLRPAAIATPRVVSGLYDELGRAVTVSCASCHANFEPNHSINSAEQLVEFHTGMVYAHGGLTCISCHNPGNYNALRLVDGRELPFENVMNLCAQCHAPQYRDYQRGAHGGMTGYWDRTRGEQHRKNCIDCHDPHAPKFPAMIPTFRPHDRFLEPPRDHQ